MGTITIDGRKLNKIKRRQILRFSEKYRRGVSAFPIVKDRNIYDNVAFAQKVIGSLTCSIKMNVPTMLSMVGLAEIRPIQSSFREARSRG